MSSKSFPSSRVAMVTLVGAIFFALIVAVVILRRGPTLPRPGSQAYEKVTRAFYHGLAALEVGLLDDARQQFGEATKLVADEPASWANLGLTQLRLGELEAAVQPVSRALELAPTNGDIVLLAARMEDARGNVEQALSYLRRAVDLDARGLRARFALAEELERSGRSEADREALMLMDQLLALAPDNLAVLLERTRLAAKRTDGERLRDSVARLERNAATWPPAVTEQYRALQSAVNAGNFADAARATVFLRNVLAPVPAFAESRGRVRTPAELIAEPFQRFLALAPPTATPAPPDPSLAFRQENVGVWGGGNASAIVALPIEGANTNAFFAADEMSVRRLDKSSPPIAFPGVAGNGLLALDWNHDFRVDLVMTGHDGLRLMLQGEGGSFTDQTSRASAVAPFTCDCFAAWAADVEMDGDLDIVVAATDGPTKVLRNNGDGTWRSIDTFAEVSGARAFAWADLDGDTDPDAAFIDAAGRLHLLLNQRVGRFVRASVPDLPSALIALTIADMDFDGVFDVVTLDAAGAVRRVSRRGEGWDSQEIASSNVAASRLLVADLDNNGALDLIASGPTGSRIWLADEHHVLQPLSTAVGAEVFSAFDLNGDGRLDLIGLASGQPVRLSGSGALAYHWKEIHSRAQQNAGDQRINSFGVGGEIEVRSGLLWQKQVMASGTSHFGLGTRTSIDVARIVWPNGVPQAEFGARVDDTLVAEQRLKGSCPWVFAWDGRTMQFVTDFLWRSPLGLRINAQDTAGVAQTEDWVRIRGDQLVARAGIYDLRVTAELWETHFLDHVSLMVVDHPAGTEALVDERFSAAKPPALAVQMVGELRPIARAWDEHGQEVTELVKERDGRYLATFERGQYQGIARDHFVEFELREDLPATTRTVLVASGWVYPTDSSINMAIGQGQGSRPAGISLEALGSDSRWVVVEADLGFPAGKNKTMLVDLSHAGGARRLRLRTNLEVYWDSLAAATRVDVPSHVSRLPLAGAELRFRGFSQTISPRGETPETPLYNRIANTTQRWPDLIGYYTRYGDVSELLAGVDDRYVIMNAGDELRLRFDEPPLPRDGWRRDFVLVSDGWEKDGDFNTGFSQTVLPLPSHDTPSYGSRTASAALEDDPVYKRHRDDWSRYHTRYVTPELFVAGLRPR